MGKRKKNPEKKTLYAIYGRLSENDTYGYVYASLAKSSVFQKLSIGARNFYFICRIQAKSPECRHCIAMYASEEKRYFPEQCFVFPAKHLAYYGIKRQNGTRYLKDLQKAGFIKTIEQNKHRYKVNIYSFDDAWKYNSS